MGRNLEDNNLIIDVDAES